MPCTIWRNIFLTIWLDSFFYRLVADCAFVWNFCVFLNLCSPNRNMCVSVRWNNEPPKKKNNETLTIHFAIFTLFSTVPKIAWMWIIYALNLDRHFCKQLCAIHLLVLYDSPLRFAPFSSFRSMFLFQCLIFFSYSLNLTCKLSWRKTGDISINNFSHLFSQSL